MSSSKLSSAAAGSNPLGRWFFAPMPAERLATLRVLVLGFCWVYALVRFGNLTTFSHFSPRSFAPVGPVSVLSAPLPGWAVLSIWLLCVITGALAVVGAWWRVAGPLFALSLLWVTSYRNSWGMLFHTENLMVLHALLLAVSPAADVWSWDRRGLRRDANREQVYRQAGLYGWVIQALCVVTVLTYVLAGIAKLRISGLNWASGYELRAHIAYDAVRKIELGSIHSPLAQYVVAWEWVFPPLAWLTLLFELGAPLALMRGRFAGIWCAVAWGFHAGVLGLMAIVFAYPLSGCAFASFFAVENLGQWVLGKRRGQSRNGGSSPLS